MTQVIAALLLAFAFAILGLLVHGSQWALIVAWFLAASAVFGGSAAYWRSH